MLIDLAQPRIFPITDRGQTYFLETAPITKAQWLAYFSAIESTSETVAGKRVDQFESAGARMELVNACLVDARGYRTAGDVPVTSLPEWRTLIPLAHRAAVGGLLTAVGRSESEDSQPLMLGFETVSIDATWTWNGTDAMVRYPGLLHIFGSPSVEQQRRYSRDMSRSQIIGGSRTGKTRWLGAQATLVALYDELITAVKGYAVNGTPLNFDVPDPNAIIRNMDTYHKVAAAEALFSPVTPVMEEA